MKTQIRLFIVRALIIVATMCALVFLALTSFWMGRLAGALAPVRTIERPMCMVRDVGLRESPTGYVISQIPEGSMVWFLKLDLPFAYVAYYDGSAWLEGSVTASVLDVCEGR